eukprot:150590-Karenia_brevis.AAC.1
MSHEGNDDDGQGDTTPNSINPEPKYCDKRTQMSGRNAYTYDYPSTSNHMGSTEANDEAWPFTNQTTGICPFVADCMH